MAGVDLSQADRRAKRALPTVAAFVALLVALGVAVLAVLDVPSRSTTSEPAEPISLELTECDGSALERAAERIIGSDESATRPALKRLYEETIDTGSSQERACAAVGLANLLHLDEVEASESANTASWESKLQKSWEGWLKNHVTPLKDVALAAVGILLLLLVLARLSTGALVHPDQWAPGPWLRRAWWSSGMLLLTGASLAVPLSGRIKVEASSWWPAVAVLASAASLAALLRPWPGWKRARAVWVVTVAGAVATLLAWPFDPVQTNEEPHLALVDPVLLAGAWMAIVGVVLVAVARGLALAIEVQVRNASGIDNSSHSRMVLARLQDLGSDNPHDIRVIGSSDVTSLPEDGLTAVPDGAWATALFNLLKVVRPSAPWRVTVSQPDDATLVVDMTRNRVAVAGASIVVSVSELPSRPADEEASAGAAKETSKPGDLDELLTIAAAHTLLVLSERHRHLKVGMCGADKWQALAFHAISRRPGVPLDRRVELLHAAIDASPRYLLPRMAVVNNIDDTDLAGRVKYAEAIERLWAEFVSDLGPPDKLDEVSRGYEAAQLRMLYNQSVAWMNVRTDQAMGDKPTNDSWVSSAESAVGLWNRLEVLEGEPSPALDRLRDQSRCPAAFLLLDLESRNHPEGDLTEELKKAVAAARAHKSALDPQTRNDYYARACYRANEADPANWRKALDDLCIAATARRFAEWAPDDPSLAIFTSRNEKGHRADDLIEEFKEVVTPPPASSYLDLPLFKPHAAPLKAYGLMTLDELLAVTPVDLASTAKVHPSVAGRWIEAARLHKNLADYEDAQARANPARQPVQRAAVGDAVRLQLLGLLLGMDVTSTPDLLARLAVGEEGRAEFYNEMVIEAANLRIIPTWDQTIGCWTTDPKPENVVVQPAAG